MNAYERLIEDIDAIGEAPLPRWRTTLRGHGAAEAAILDAYRGGRLHHAFLIGGAEGIGKATFAYRVARFLLRHPDPTAPAVQAATDLAVAPDDPVARKVAQLAHPDLFVLRRSLNPESKKIRTAIAVEDARDLRHLFETTSGALGWRVAIVDTADDLNTASGNALLKMVEEPPPRAIFLILAHRPASILTTIRSRCRKLTLDPLSEADTAAVVDEIAEDAEPEARAAAVARAAGSPRRALELLDEGHLEVVLAAEALLQRLPQIDVRALHALADKVARRDAEGPLALVRDTLAGWVAGRIRAGVHQGEDLGRLARLAERLAGVEAQHRLADVYNLDRKQAVLSAFTELAAALGRSAPRGQGA